MMIVKKPNAKMLEETAKQLKRGAVVVYPTDTAYGLGCDATNAKAVARIFQIKGREAQKALPVIVSDLKMAKKFFVLDAAVAPLAARHWPGPFSIVVGAKKAIAKKVLSAGTAAVRVPDSEMARALSEYLGRPLVATSANLSGQPACYSLRSFMKQAAKMKTKPDIAIDAGALRRRRPSTIVRIDESGEIEVLRKGPVKFDISAKGVSASG